MTRKEQSDPNIVCPLLLPSERRFTATTNRRTRDQDLFPNNDVPVLTLTCTRRPELCGSAKMIDGVLEPGKVIVENSRPKAALRALKNRATRLGENCVSPSVKK